MKNPGFLNILHDELHIDKLFEELIHIPWRKKEFNPSFDLYETEDYYIFEVDCPGMTMENIHISLKGNAVEVSGERFLQTQMNTRNHHIKERAYGKFIRIIQLPTDVDRDSIKSEMDHGVLRIYLSKLNGLK